MEEVAQGRVWTGKDAASRGLVDAIGGFSLAVAIAKQKASIPQDRQVGSLQINLFKPNIVVLSKESMPFIYFGEYLSPASFVYFITSCSLEMHKWENVSVYISVSGEPVVFRMQHFSVFSRWAVSKIFMLYF